MSPIPTMVLKLGQFLPNEAPIFRRAFWHDWCYD